MTTEQLLQAIQQLPPELKTAVDLIVWHGMEPQARYNGSIAAARECFVTLCFDEHWPERIAKQVWEIAEHCLKPHDDIPF